MPSEMTHALSVECFSLNKPTSYLKKKKSEGLSSLECTFSPSAIVYLNGRFDWEFCVCGQGTLTGRLCFRTVNKVLVVRLWAPIDKKGERGIALECPH